MAEAKAKSDAAVREHETIAHEANVADAKLRLVAQKVENEQRKKKLDIEADVANQVVQNVNEQTKEIVAEEKRAHAEAKAAVRDAK